MRSLRFAKCPSNGSRPRSPNAPPSLRPHPGPKDVLRDQKRSAERTEQRRSAERIADDHGSPDPIRPQVSNPDALALMVQTMLSADTTLAAARDSASTGAQLSCGSEPPDGRCECVGWAALVPGS